MGHALAQKKLGRTMVGSARVGPAAPTIDLVLQSTNSKLERKKVIWRIWGTNSMVKVSNEVLCLEDIFLQFDLANSKLGSAPHY